MKTDEIALVRKHLPHGWTLCVKLALRPPDGREAREIPPETWPQFVERAQEMECRMRDMMRSFDRLLNQRTQADD